jgi:hypothetical protein
VSDAMCGRPWRLPCSANRITIPSRRDVVMTISLRRRTASMRREGSFTALMEIHHTAVN